MKKIRLIITLLAAVVAMSVMAVATGSSTYGISLAPGEEEIAVYIDETGTHHVTVMAPGGATSLTINGISYTNNSGTDPTPFNVGAKFTVRIDGVETTSVSGNFPDGKEFIVNYTNNKGAPNGDYTIEYNATYVDGSSHTTAHLVAPADIIAIPEFPTVALPVAAVIGLVYFFQRKKEE